MPDLMKLTQKICGRILKRDPVDFWGEHIASELGTYSCSDENDLWDEAFFSLSDKEIFEIESTAGYLPEIIGKAFDSLINSIKEATHLKCVEGSFKIIMGSLDYGGMSTISAKIEFGKLPIRFTISKDRRSFLFSFDCLIHFATLDEE